MMTLYHFLCMLRISVAEKEPKKNDEKLNFDSFHTSIHSGESSVNA